MPDGSDADGSYWNAGWQWAQISSYPMNWNYWYNDNCTLKHGNGRSETGLMSRSNISGNDGLTTTTYDSYCTWAWSTQHIIESDVVLASDMMFYPEDESLWNWDQSDVKYDQGQVANVHEFGHALGLDHTQGFDIMRVSVPIPLAGGNSAEPYPDDAAGVRNMYGGTGLANMFASAQKFSGGVLQSTDTATNPASNPPVSRCRGQTISVTYTVVNNGAISTTSGFRIYMNTGPTAGTGWNMWTGTATVSAQNLFTETRTLTIPSVPNGFYDILWQIDTDNTVSEYNENDNTVHSAMVVSVFC